MIKSEDKKILKRIVHLYKPYIKNIVAIILCMVVSAAISTILPLLSKDIVDKGLIENNFSLLIKLVLTSFFLVLADQGIGFLEIRYRLYISLMIPYELSKKAFKHTMKLDMKYFNSTNYGEIMNNLDMDVGNISKIADNSLFFIVTQVFKIIGGVIGLFLIDWKLTLVVLLIIPAKYKVVKILAKKRQEHFEKYMEVRQEYSSWYGDTLSGVKELKFMGLERIKTGEFIKQQRKLFKEEISINILDKINEVSESVMFEIVTGLLYILGAYLIVGAKFTVGGLMAFITYSIYVTAPISAVLNIGYDFSNIIPSAKRFFKFIDMEPEESTQAGKKRVACDMIEGNIKFENLSFSYDGVKEILNNISFQINKGEKIAIIGANGSGKTTIINLLLRVLKPTSGKIYIDDMDISSISLKDYRSLISVVNQNPYLFNTTIKDNILPGSKDYEKLYSAVKEIKIENFIESLPEKYETIVGVNGANISGGQKQKIAMARAIAKDSKIMILDEATSNYDIESELSVIELILNGLEDRTVIMVTHKRQVLEVVDKIIFIENGEIVDIGKHDELYERSESYKELIGNFKECVPNL